MKMFRALGTDRRHFLGGGASLLAASLVGACQLRLPQIPTQLAELIDVHAHAFNASDLPVERFIRLVLLKLDLPADSDDAKKLGNADYVDALIGLLTWLLGVERAPTAAAEIRVLQGRAAPAPGSSESGVERLFVRRLTSYLERNAEVQEQGASARDGEADLRADLFEAGGSPPPSDFESNMMRLAPQARLGGLGAIAANAFLSNSLVGRVLRWFALFKMYRHALIDRWVRDQRALGAEPLLMAPATIDFSCWLQQTVESKLPDQARVMGLIAAQRRDVAVHGYIAFDPLRAAYFRHGLPEAEFDPLSVVREALTQHGFLGVKLYPPMGFKPWDNNSSTKEDFPLHVRRKLGNVGAELDQSLEDLYRLCERFDAPILAHATDSNSSHVGYELRADPYYWRPVFDNHPHLRVCLAHFGRFKAKSAGTTEVNMPAASWEWNLGAYVAAHRDSSVYADLSFWSEALVRDRNARTALAQNMRDFIRQFDPELKRLMFGTDWIMTGIVKDYRLYAQSIVHFLQEDCQLSDTEIHAILVDNPRRFMGLNEGSVAFTRLQAFYAASDREMPAF
ncbi:amidohydrolase family protein [Dongia rigui]|uniref:Amidohydrolase family protein n=1 Tax=Dongia rigui TaxID=940149 RepID=A0ABU5E5L8_9PROT|nr:amidohydrolase family protein [Dongia rigui]MDY0874357.1 amidohydrolase family protein [Dongia rigui]